MALRCMLGAKKFIERAVSCPWTPQSLKIHSTNYMNHQVQVSHVHFSKMVENCTFNMADSIYFVFENICNKSTTYLQSVASDIYALQNLFHSLASDSDVAHNFKHCIKRVLQCHDQQKRVFVTGIGKSGAVAQRLASTLSSISISSQWIHGGEWVHGELGGLKHDDMVIIISHSGQTSELLPLPEMFRKSRGFVVAIVGDGLSPLSQQCDLSIVASADDEAGCPVPSRSIIVQEAICNAMVQHLIECLVDGPEQFKDSHPGGAIGARFTNGTE